MPATCFKSVFGTYYRGSFARHVVDPVAKVAPEDIHTYMIVVSLSMPIGNRVP